jgi:hypothetical protein
MIALSMATNPLLPPRCNAHAQRAHGHNVRVGPGAEQETAVIASIEKEENRFVDLDAIRWNGPSAPHRLVERR